MDDFLVHASSVQVYLFAFVLVFFWIAELVMFTDKATFKWKHFKINGLFIISALLIQLSLTPFLISVSTYVTTHGFGVVYLIPGHENPWVFTIVLILMMDLCEYFYHVIMHKLKFFWIFHLVHHTDSHVDVSTTVREHPVETFIRACFTIVWVLICGASPGVLIIRQTIQSIANISAHTRFRLKGRPEKILGWIFITPNLHHVHHHYQLPYTDCNYGDVLSIWDRLFGTYRELEPGKTTYGIDTHMHIKSSSCFLDLIAIPFKKCVKKSDHPTHT